MDFSTRHVFLTAVLFIQALAFARALDYGSGGKYGFRSCRDPGIHPGEVSCLNFDSYNSTFSIGVGPAPKAPLYFSGHWSLANTTTLAALGLLAKNNAHAAVSAPNALLGSRYNTNTTNINNINNINNNNSNNNKNSPEDVDAPGVAPAWFSSSVANGTFDLFGFYVQPMWVDPESGMKGVDVTVRGVPADPEQEALLWMVTFPLKLMDGESLYFDAVQDTGEEWAGLRRVEVSADLVGAGGEPEGDMEFWVDDVWVRWGPQEPDSADTMEPDTAHEDSQIVLGAGEL